MAIIKLIGQGAWTLVVIWFEDTSDWTKERLIFAKRAFAVAMMVLVLASLIFTVGALSQEDLSRHIERIERRQDVNFDQHAEIKQRLSVVESETATNAKANAENARQTDRLIWGVIGLSIATIGQLLLALLKFKLEKDHEDRQ